MIASVRPNSIFKSYHLFRQGNEKLELRPWAEKVYFP